MGSLISSRSIPKLESLIASAVKSGATLHCGGSRLNHPVYPNGHYFQPTLLSDVTPDMTIAQTELFAPVFLLMRATSVPDAIDIANSTPYSLGASVFGHHAPTSKIASVPSAAVTSPSTTSASSMRVLSPSAAVMGAATVVSAAKKV